MRVILTGDEKARAMLRTSASRDELVTTLKENKSAMPKDSITLCSDPNCDSPKVVGGMCNKHYMHAYYRRHFPNPKTFYTHCTIEGCASPHLSRGMCNAHYKRWQKYGDPKVLRVQKTVELRFWSRVHKTETCWLWTGAIDAGGYGAFAAPLETGGRARYILAHRYAHEFLKGPIPDGLTIDHLCRVRNCVNPDHLEAVTTRENTVRGISPPARNAVKTHCKHGHIFDEANTRTSSGFRACRACETVRRHKRNCSRVK